LPQVHPSTHSTKNQVYDWGASTEEKSKDELMMAAYESKIETIRQLLPKSSPLANRKVRFHRLPGLMEQLPEADLPSSF